MDKDSTARRDILQHPISDDARAALNRERCAWIHVCGHEVFTVDLARPHQHPQALRWSEGSKGSLSAVALSHMRPSLLALASSSQVYVTDVRSESCGFTVRGIGRATTSVAFANHDAAHLATGHIDGSICTWHLATLERPQRRLLADSGACHILAFAQTHADILASVHQTACYIWNLGSAVSLPICTLCYAGLHITALAWSCSKPARLAICFANRHLRVFDLESVIQSSLDSGRSDVTNDNISSSISEHSHGISLDLHQIAKLALDDSLSSVVWTGASVLLGLTQAGNSGRIFRLNDIHLECIWSCRFAAVADAISLLQQDGRIVLLGLGRHGVQSHVVPETVCHEAALGGSAVPFLGPHVSNSSSQPRHEMASNTTWSPAMKPISFSALRSEDSAFARTSRQLQKIRTRKSKKGYADTRYNTPHDLDDPEPLNGSMTFSLDLPGYKHEGSGSPMPFLSPSIPSRRVSPSAIPPLEVVTRRSASSLDSPPPSTRVATRPAPNGYDSDDESYTGDLQGSINFLPGGINVPLPKACGALFTPTGHLLTFFPPKQQHVSPRGDAVDLGMRPRKTRTEALAKLFTGFGNIESYVDSLSGESRTDSSVISDEDRPPHIPNPDDTTKQYDPPDHSAAKMLVLRPTFDSEDSDMKLIVKIYEINGIPVNSLVLKETAQKYRILLKSGENGHHLCSHNAKVAKDADLEDNAAAWLMLSKLLEDQAPLQNITVPSHIDDVVVVAQRLRLLRHDDFQATMMSQQEQLHISGKLRWAEHPLSAAWLIRRIIQWGEERADVQFLACVTAVLLQVKLDVSEEQSVIGHMPAHSTSSIPHSTFKSSNDALKGAIPLLSTSSAPTPSWDESPTKLVQDAIAFSRSTSGPNTPHLETDSPLPWVFPSFSCQSTRLVTPGSASPETNRNSFSAAVKNYASSYAQSMSDKVASYGTTPPATKMNISSGADGVLSSSMPVGSWPGKSVSFASATTSDDRLENSWSRNDQASAEEDADSDRTLEDSSTPRTPRSPVNAGSFLLSNEDMFADEMSGSTRAELIPKDLEEASKAWCLYYADLLRGWDMHIKATEFEKVIGLDADTSSESDTSALTNDGMQAVFRDGLQKASCTVCDSITTGKVQMCPSCLHVSHFECVEDFVAELDDEPFSCPAGCGCTCSELPYIMRAVPKQSPPQTGFKKKASVTDPVRWRALVGGDGWD